MKKDKKIPLIKNGSVIDHIPSKLIFKIIKILNPNDYNHVISIGLNLESNKIGSKGVIKIDNRTLTKDEVNKIAILAPNATLNIIRDYKVVEKTKVSLPDELNGLVKCQNPNCITNFEKNLETNFIVIEKNPIVMKCHYCEKHYKNNDIKVV